MLKRNAIQRLLHSYSEWKLPQSIDTHIDTYICYAIISIFSKSSLIKGKYFHSFKEYSGRMFFFLCLSFFTTTIMWVDTILSIIVFIFRMKLFYHIPLKDFLLQSKSIKKFLVQIFGCFCILHCFWYKAILHWWMYATYNRTWNRLFIY